MGLAFHDHPLALLSGAEKNSRFDFSGGSPLILATNTSPPKLLGKDDFPFPKVMI